MKDLLKNLLPLFTVQLANLFDKLRVASPLVYLIILAVVVGGGEFLRGSDTILVNAPEWLDYVIIIVEVVTPILLSSRTKRHMDTGVSTLTEKQISTLSSDQVKVLRDHDD